MRTDHHDIKINIKLGQDIFENLPNDIRPGWAGLVLSRFDNYIKDIPTSILELFPMIDDKDCWKEAHKQFSKIRTFGLENENYLPKYLRLAELVAKVTYNASGQPAPFDSDSGHFISSLALKATEYFADDRLEEEVKSALLLFSRNNKFKGNLIAAKDLLLYKKIDDILWFDWDPIGINDMARRDEYQSYVPEIFGLLKSNASRQEIANRLHKLETENMGMRGTIESCLVIADKILNAK
ncbi:hypothetical protein [Desertivirga arenae]|uniref:hypothetical protein n=1 Tax=Desertivirga arenae TaxID=2810309 RepID=UPI001A9733DD|nr:hypothetical protein [Pedobacter sp. SYSU D00823]